jgi:hypothetical protein
MLVNRGVLNGVEGSSLRFIHLRSRNEAHVLCKDRLGSHGNDLTNSGSG